MLLDIYAYEIEIDGETVIGEGLFDGSHDLHEYIDTCYFDGKVISLEYKGSILPDFYRQDD